MMYRNSLPWQSGMALAEYMIGIAEAIYNEGGIQVFLEGGMSVLKNELDKRRTSRHEADPGGSVQ